MIAIEKIGNAWKSKSGEIRYYVNTWKSMIGLNIEYHKSGNVSGVKYHDKIMSNCWYKKYVSETKVWVGTDGNVHVDHCKDDDVKKNIIDTITALISE